MSFTVGCLDDYVLALFLLCSCFVLAYVLAVVLIVCSSLCSCQCSCFHRLAVARAGFNQEVSAEAVPEVLMYAKNIHSRAYNKRKNQCKRQGLSHEECLKQAREAGNQAVQDAKDRGILVMDPVDVD